MSIQSLAAQRAALIRSINSNSAPPETLISHLASPLQSVSTWLGLEAWVNGIGIRSTDSDFVLRWLIKNCRDQPGTHSQELFLLVAWDSLLGLHRVLLRLDEDVDGLWSNLTWSFLRVVCRFDLNMRPGFIGKKLLNDTQHDTRQCYAKFRNDPSFNQTTDPENDPLDRVQVGDLGHASADILLDRSLAIKHLRRLVRSGHLSRPDFQILLGCHLYGRSINEMAVHLGIPYGAAKKRRQRAVKKLQKSAPHLSPSDPDSPLYPIERNSRKEADYEIDLPLPRNRNRRI